MSSMIKKVCKICNMKILLWLWGIWWIFSASYFDKIMIPTFVSLTAEEPYTVNSVWHYGRTGYLNDVLLYTLFTGKTVYINPESWYYNYVKAYSDEVILNEELVAIQNSSEIQIDDYTSMGKMCLTVNDVLFTEEVFETISANELGGVVDLYINEKDILETDGIDVFHDENGSIYLGGHVDE